MAVAADAGLRRDRLILLASLIGIVALAWTYLFIDAARMEGMAGMAMPATARTPLAAGPLTMTFLMWTIMMVGMMLPSAAPAILVYAGLVRKRRAAGSAAPSACVFLAGYLAVWAAFSLGAAVLQAGLEQGRLVTPMLVSATPILTGGLLVLAGVYQFLPIKDACLQKCRAPLQFFMFRWRTGTLGAFRMGAEHGAFCVGCCWALMLLLLVAGVMNLLWVAALAALVLAEKLLPHGGILARIMGAVLTAAGAAMLCGAL